MCAAVSQQSDAAARVREQVLRGAEECFARFGPTKTTMGDVARSAAVSRATVYRYFSDREELVVAAVERRVTSTMPRAQAHIARWPTFPEQLVRGTLYNVDWARRDPFVKLILTSGMSARTIGSEVIAVELTRRLWEPVFTRAQASGVMRRELDHRAAAGWLASITLMLVARDPPGEEDDLLRELRTFLLPAFLAE